ncbi:endophilin-A2 isoform X3 [Myotis lucifugus]|uniref:endophilin-A2 isoform X3 n=1 Tax=Myotis lucifugus TaxID=59463 RepID=UPI000CCBFE28|nr:endophilin-A2 isoform X3 [Myotis lucifugus]XP_023603616.1 endophilin-A2 isoform X3 [Myotis lucifugus]
MTSKRWRRRWMLPARLWWKCWPEPSNTCSPTQVGAPASCKFFRLPQHEEGTLTGQADDAQHGIQDPWAGEESWLPAVGGPAGRVHDSSREGAGWRVQLRHPVMASSPPPTPTGDALLDAGESMKCLAEVKDSLDIEVKQNFIDPLQNLCDKDLKEIQHHLKKLEGRRLDFDYKKKRQGKIPDEELRQALEKFEESKEVAETSMHNLLETDIEQVSQLSALVDAQLEYHRQAVQILDELASKLKRRMREASSRPKREYKPKPRESFDLGEPEQSNGGFPAPKISASSSFRSSDKPVRTPSRSMPPLDQPSCKALYDFEPENDGELGFHEGDIITLTNQIDENWYEGMLHGQSGFFPLSYVEVLVPLPQ